MSIDTLISKDLAALGEDNRRQLVGLDDALQTTNMYRDDRPGAEARRDALAEERKRELVMMPLTLAHVFAHRIGRAAAGGAALLGSLVLIAMLADPLLLHFAGMLIPGLNVGMLAALTAIMILAVYMIATWVAEAWFARRMRAAIQTGDDAYRDLDHLARGPVEIAQQAVRRVDGWSLGLFVGGASALVLVFGYIVSVVGALHAYPYAWSVRALADGGTLEKNLDILTVALFIALAVTYLVARACHRGERSWLVTALSHWGVLGIAIAALATTARLGIDMVMGLHGWHSRLPSVELRYTLAIGATIVVVIVTCFALLWLRRREQTRVGE